MTVTFLLRTALAGAVVTALAVTAAPTSAAAARSHRPDRPTGLTTDRATDCAATPPSLIGIGDVTLFAPVSDPDGGHLGVTFQLRHGKDLIVSTDPETFTWVSGTTAYYRIRYDTLGSVAAGAITPFTWRVRATDAGGKVGPWSAVCSFRYDPTRPAAPVVTPPANGSTKIGTPVSIPVAKGEDGVVPTRFAYMLNGGSDVGEVDADADGSATITVTPRWSTNSLEVRAVSAGGNSGDRTTVTFNSIPGDLADEGDFTGDGHTDLLVVGAEHGLPSGVWLIAGDGAGGLAPQAVNLGYQGLGGGPAELDGMQVSAGRFTGGTFQDPFLYSPRWGHAAILRGNGDGSPIRPIDGNVFYVNGGLLRDDNGFDPIQIVRGGRVLGKLTPDLIGTAGNAEFGYYLNYIPSVGGIAAYWPRSLPGRTTPTGDLAWNTWTLASTATTDGVTTLFLWQKTTGKLYAWRDVTFDVETEEFSYTEQHLSDSFYPGQAVTLQASDINGDDVADLWAVGPTATATPWMVTPSGTITAGPAQPITPAP